MISMMMKNPKYQHTNSPFPHILFNNSTTNSSGDK